ASSLAGSHRLWPPPPSGNPLRYAVTLITMTPLPVWTRHEAGSRSVTDIMHVPHSSTMDAPTARQSLTLTVVKRGGASARGPTAPAPIPQGLPRTAVFLFLFFTV